MPIDKRSHPAPRSGAGTLLDSWKEIATYVGRNVRTAQRWEQKEQLPVHRHQHGQQDTVYAYTAEIDRWIEERDGLARNGSNAKPRTLGKAWLAVFVVAALVAGAERLAPALEELLEALAPQLAEESHALREEP